MPSIFISYRQDDARAWAIALRDHLVRTFGTRQVFLDLDSLESGRWQPQIEGALNECAVVLVVIGPRWASAVDAHGRQRLMLSDDVHRLEVASSLKRPGATVIPVLVDRARLPAAAELPDDLRGILDRQASDLGDAHDRRIADLRRLTGRIDIVIGQRREQRRAVAAAVAIVALSAVAA